MVGGELDTRAPLPDAPRERWLAIALVAILGLGLAPRTWHWISGHSLSADECAAAVSAIDTERRPGALEPLSLGQVAPPGFVAVLRGASSLFGPSERSLRGAAFLAGSGALLLSATLFGRHLPAVGRVAAVSVVALSPMAARYSAEVKSYSFDLLAAVLLPLLLLSPAARSWRAGVRLALAGAALATLSFGTAFVACGLVCALIPVQFRTTPAGSTTRHGAWGAIVVAASSAIVLSLTRSRLPTDRLADLQRYWWKGDGDLTGGLDATIASLAGWVESVGRLLGFTGGAAILLCSISVVGLVVAARRDALARCYGGILAAALAATVLRLYPVRDRLALVLLPGVALGLAVSVGWLHRVLAARSPRIAGPAALLSFLLLLLPGAARARPGVPLQNPRALLEGVAAARSEGEWILISCGAKPSFFFYGVRAGLAGTRLHPGARGCFRPEQDDPGELALSLAGLGRGWVVISHGTPLAARRLELSAALSRVGVVLRTVEADSLSGGEIAWLYDFGARRATPSPAGRGEPGAGPSSASSAPSAPIDSPTRAPADEPAEKESPPAGASFGS